MMSTRFLLRAMALALLGSTALPSAAGAQDRSGPTEPGEVEAFLDGLMAAHRAELGDRRSHRGRGPRRRALLLQGLWLGGRRSPQAGGSGHHPLPDRFGDEAVHVDGRHAARGPGLRPLRTEPGRDSSRVASGQRPGPGPTAGGIHLLLELRHSPGRLHRGARQRDGVGGVSGGADPGAARHGARNGPPTPPRPPGTSPFGGLHP